MDPRRGELVSVGIVELGDRCDRLATANRELFETLGAWVADETDPGRQRRFAAAAHRHAWHAELWDERRPKIPVDSPAHGPGDAADDLIGDDRVGWYRSRLAEVHDQIDELARETDPMLDPSTRRVVALTRHDLNDLDLASGG